MQILRAGIFHVPGNPFDGTALQSHADGALAIESRRIVACGDYSDVRAAHPDVPVIDHRGSYLMPGFIDTHVHFPQARILGALGHSLLDWLQQVTLPEEARLQDPAYATPLAAEFVRALATNGTTTALVFGSHFEQATAALFEAAKTAGVRVFSGLVFSDCGLLQSLHLGPGDAHDAALRLIARFPSRYVVTPRFALSASPAMLEVCRSLLRSDPALRFTTHINESPEEIELVRRQFPQARDYLEVYESHGLIDRRAVLAHNVRTTDSELARLAAARATIAHCPCSNAALGSGIFPMKRHLRAGVRFSLGTDVGAGTGFSLLKEALQAHLMQRVAPEPLQLTPAQMLYLATRAGAEALGIEETVGDFSPGKSADYVRIAPRESSLLRQTLQHADSESRALGALFALAGEADIREVAVEGGRVAP